MTDPTDDDLLPSDHPYRRLLLHPKKVEEKLTDLRYVPVQRGAWEISPDDILPVAETQEEKNARYEHELAALRAQVDFLQGSFLKLLQKYGQEND